MNSPATEEARLSICSWWIGAAVLLALTVCMFGDVLFASGSTVLSSRETDLAGQFIYWREFTANQLRHGHLPLWNPYVFCGMPFLGAAPTGVLYPSNWLDLVLPLPRSINLGIMLHVFLTGFFTYAWGLRRGLHPVAAVTAGALCMFSGAYFLHVYAGHASICAIAWMPLLFACIEGWIETRTLGWLLLGTTAITMQIFAADPQQLFYTAVAAGLLAAFDVIHTRQRVKALLGFLGMYAGAAALGAVQLLTSYHAASESVRSHGVDFGFASMLSFAPENFLTLVAPGFFGNLITMPYWGRWYLWEMCLFIGVSGLALAVYGSVCGERKPRRALVPLVAIMLVLALGSYTPLFRFLYNYVPGFDKFRTNAKFIMEATLFLVMLAGTGLDRLFHDPPGRKWLALGLVAASVIAGSVALELRSAALAREPASWWSRAMRAVYATRESYAPAETYTDLSFVRDAGVFASKCLFTAATELLILSGLVVAAATSRKAVYAIALMAIVEVFLFARSSLATFDISSTQSPGLKAFLDQHPGDYRIYYERVPNIAMWLGKEDVWGYGQLMLKRYAEFMAFTQGENPDDAGQYLELSHFHPLHALLRWRYAFLADKDGDHIATANSVMPRLQLLQEYRVVSGRDEILQALASPSFDPRQQVILETEPGPAPAPFADKGTATVIDSSASELTVEADLPHPAILLITDAYSYGWQARPLEGSAQNVYKILPANYVLRAIPLSQGHHRIRLEYSPHAFRVGAWISVVSLMGFVLLAGRHIRKNRFSCVANSPAS